MSTLRKRIAYRRTVLMKMAKMLSARILRHHKSPPLYSHARVYLSPFSRYV
jgi:hypothetical protein